jgi:hypothetical protein
MCKAFSCIVTRSSQVAWRMGLDSHDQIFQAFKDTMPELKDDGAMTRFIKIEIAPDNDNYFDAESPWTLRIDEDEIPDWYTSQHKAAAMQAMREWRNQLYAIVDLNELRHLVNPFSREPHPIDEEVLSLASEWKATVGGTVGETVWATVRATVGGTVWGTVWATVWGTVGATVRDTVRGTVGETVWGTVWATVRATVGGTVWDIAWVYIGSLFPGAWKNEYPYSPAVKLWKMGLVICSDGRNWYLVSKNGIEHSQPIFPIA